MALMIAGLVLFIGLHLLPTLPAAREKAVAALGANRYRLLFSAVSVAGLVAIVLGYRAADPGVRLFAPVELARALAPLAMAVAFVLFAAANAPAHLRASLKHPMLIGTLLWSGVHLLANGDTRGTILFGAFFAYAGIDLISTIRRRAVKRFVPRARADVISMIAGIVAAALVMILHRILFGPAVASFGF